MEANKKNLWDIEFGQSFYNFFDNFQDFINYLNNSRSNNEFLIKEMFDLKNDDNFVGVLEKKAIRENFKLIYTDYNHPIAVSNFSLLSNFISPAFFNEHKEEFINYYRNIFSKKLFESDKYVKIYDFSFDENYLNEIIKHNEKKYTYIMIEGKELSDNFINTIKENHIYFEIKKGKEINKISTNIAFSFYTFNDLDNISDLNIEINNLSEEDIKNLDNLKYLNQSATINIMSQGIINEKLYYEKIKKLVNFLSKHNKTYNIKFNVYNREIFKNSHLLENVSDNFNIFIENDLSEYDLKSYLNEEIKLDNLIRTIKDANLSQFEKYLAVYNVVKQFKEYKENSNDLEQSRYIRYILDNEYIVCLGFAKLLEMLLDKLDIPCINIGADIDISYKDGFTMEEIPTNHNMHARNMIKIDDDKYNIHGYYLADPTWDNDLNKDLYFNSIMTFDRKKEYYRMEYLHDYDLLYDFHDIDEFKEKISIYIKRKNNGYIYDYTKYGKPKNLTPDEYKKKFINDYFDTYKTLLNDIFYFLKKLDYEKFDYFYNKYDYFYKNFNLLDNVSLDDITNKINEFLNEYYQYIINKVNNKVDNEVIFNAASEVLKVINGFSDEEIISWRNEQNELYNKFETVIYPYKYDPNSKEAYLDDNVVYDESSKHVR